MPSVSDYAGFAKLCPIMRKVAITCKIMRTHNRIISRSPLVMKDNLALFAEDVQVTTSLHLHCYELDWTNDVVVV